MAALWSGSFYYRPQSIHDPNHSCEREVRILNSRANGPLMVRELLTFQIGLASKNDFGHKTQPRASVDAFHN